MGKMKPALPRKTVWMDERGRVTLPVELRRAAGLEEGWVVVEAYPDAQNVKSVNVRPDT